MYQVLLVREGLDQRANAGAVGALLDTDRSCSQTLCDLTLEFGDVFLPRCRECSAFCISRRGSSPYARNRGLTVVKRAKLTAWLREFESMIHPNMSGVRLVPENIASPHGRGEGAGCSPGEGI